MIGDRFSDLEPYEPPTGDEPLDAIELAIVRALVPIIVAKLPEWVAEDRRRAESPCSKGSR